MTWKPLPWYLVSEPPDPPALQVCEDFSNCVEDETQGLPAVLHPQTKNLCHKCFPQTLRKQWCMPLLLALRRQRQSALKLGSTGVAGIS